MYRLIALISGVAYLLFLALGWLFLISATKWGATEYLFAVFTSAMTATMAAQAAANFRNKPPKPPQDPPLTPVTES